MKKEILEKRPLREFFKYIKFCKTCGKQYGSDYKNDRGTCVECRRKELESYRID